MKFLSLVWGNLKRRKLRTALTILSVFVAFVLYGLLCTIKEAFTGQIALAGVDRLIVRHKVSLIMLLPEAYKARIERIPGVASAVHLTWFNGIYQNEPKNFFWEFPDRARAAAGDLPGDCVAGGPKAGVAKNAQRGDRGACPGRSV